MFRKIPILLLLIACGTQAEAATREKPATPEISFEQVKGVLGKYCYNCHGEEKKKADLSLQEFQTEADVFKQRFVWDKVLKNIQTREMPPENKPQPSTAERDLIEHYIQSKILHCDCTNPDPGRVTIRRLNRAEYNNTIRDLVGVKFQPADDFPADDTGYGFDNIGDVLSLSPMLFEKYLSAAEKIISQAVAAPEIRDRVFLAKSKLAGDENQHAREIITQFARRAYRRPLSENESNRLFQFYETSRKDGQNFENSVSLALQAVLVSPHFLFRGESQPNPDHSTENFPIDEFALASRLSYFLWSSMPDEELFALAEKGKLRRNLNSQVKRMLKNPKSEAFVQNFVGQWLQLRNLKLVQPDPVEFPSFDDDLRAAMQRETEMLFAYVMREDRSVLELLDANYTFLNERLAAHYRISTVRGSEFRKVKLKGDERGGILTQASILTLTSNPTRTSPVKRGKWVLENILGTPPPPAPANVPDLPEGKEALKGTLRQRLEQHRANPSCASCHAIMDPIGFGMENFNGIGSWRKEDAGSPVDASGELTTGEKFKGPAELKQILVKRKKNEFVRCLSEKMLTYALGRGLEFTDKCATDGIVKKMSQRGYHFETLVLEIVNSTPFQMRRGENGNTGERASAN